MANKKISELPTGSAPSGAELIELVQGGINVKLTAQEVADLGGGTQNLSSVLTAGNNGGGLQIKNIADPTIAQDAATKAYVDAAALGIVTSWKAPVRVATTVAGTLASSFENGDTVDGVVLATGNRILIKNQAAQTENGIYTVNASGAPTRSTDANTGTELEGAATIAQEGTSNANTTWIQTTDSVNLGVSNIVWTQLGASVPDSSETVKGIIEIATQTETNTGTDDVRAITPLKLKNQNFLAPLASPALTGTPTAPTAAQTTNSTQIATTAFVKTESIGSKLFLYYNFY